MKHVYVKIVMRKVKNNYIFATQNFTYGKP